MRHGPHGIGGVRIGQDLWDPQDKTESLRPSTARAAFALTANADFLIGQGADTTAWDTPKRYSRRKKVDATTGWQKT